MSKWRFYKCRVPKQKRYASNGQTINFVDVGGDTGVGKTNNDWLAGEIDLMISEQRGGVFAIDEAEYDQLKKNPSSPPPWREELGRQGPEVNHRAVLPAMRQAQTPAPSPPGEAPVAAANGTAHAEPPAEAAPMERPKAVRKKV